MRILPLILFLFLTAARGAEPDPFASHVRPTPHLSPAEEQATLQVPEGFQISRFASEPQIAKPLNMAFDDKDRLWLTNTVEYPYPAKPGQKGRDSVKILEDTNGDGTADKVTTFADGLNIPIGITPYGDGAICFSIPDILYLRDTDGDGVCDKREKLYGPFDTTRDTHGMVNSFLPQPDGWIYACHGFNNRSKVSGSDGHEVEMQSGNIFRFRPDGSRIEVFTHGQVNPFGLAVNSRGDLFSADCHTKPLSLIVQGGWHQSFGKPHDGLGFIPNVMEHLHGSTAICGIAFGARTHFPPPFRDSVFSGNVTTCRVNRNTIQYKGSSPFAKEEADFVVSKDPWFRPVDLKTDSKGALYIADFYNAVIGHYEVPLDHPKRDRTSGRIWKVVWTGEKAAPSQVSAINSGTPGLSAKDSLTLRHNIMATSVQPAKENLRPLLKILDSCPAEDVQLRHAARLALRNHLRNGAWFEELMTSLSDNETREIAAICLAVKTPESAQFLIRHIGKAPKISNEEMRGILEFAAQHAQAESLDTVIKLVSERFPENPVFQKDLLVSLHKGILARGESGSPNLSAQAESLAIRLLQKDRKTNAIGWSDPDDIWSVSRSRKSADGRTNTPLWSSFPKGENKTGLLRSGAFKPGADFHFFLAGHDGYPDKPAQNKNHVVMRDAQSKAVLFSASPPRNDTAQRVAWNTIEVADGDVYLELTDGDNAGAYAWLAAGRFSVSGLNPSSLPRQRAHAADLIQQLRLTSLRPALAETLQSMNPSGSSAGKMAAALASISEDPRLLAVAEIFTIPGSGDSLKAEAMQCLCAPDKIDAVLANAMRQLPSTGQSAFAAKLVSSPKGIESLLSLIEEGQAAASVIRHPVIEKNLATVGRPEQKERAAKILAAAPPANNDIATIIANSVEGVRRNPGDHVRGQLVFEQQCAVCHKIDGKGGDLAPNLDGIGSRGLERIVEDVLDPNRNVDIAFRIITVVKKDGSAVTGFVRREEEHQLILADPAGREIAVLKNEISSRQQSNLSLMPPAFHQILTNEQLNDLFTWLGAQKS